MGTEDTMLNHKTNEEARISEAQEFIQRTADIKTNRSGFMLHGSPATLIEHEVSREECFRVIEQMAARNT